jgi:lysozyme family protein
MPTVSVAGAAPPTSSCTPRDVFDEAVEHTFGREGGFTGPDGLPNDRGGPTNMGVTLATLRAALRLDTDGDGFADGDFDRDGDIDWRDVELLPREVAKEQIYLPRYWDGPRLFRIPTRRVAIKAFDLGVHAGPRAAIAVLQRAINEASPAGAPLIRIDGRLGEVETVPALRRCGEELLLLAFAAEQSAFYLAIIDADPTQGGFRTNWLRRARWPFTRDGRLVA